MTRIPDASIVIPTVGRAALLGRLLEQLGRQSVEGFEVIVVCDGHDVATRELSEQTRTDRYALRWLFHSSQRGSAAARNTGAHAAQHDLLLFLDDDMIPDEEWLRFHRQRHDDEGSDPRVVVLGHLTEEYVKKPASRVESMHREHRRRGYARYFERCIAEGDSFSWSPHCGNNTSVNRQTFLSFGGFDESLEIASDSELGARMHAAGIRMIYERRARAVHVNTRAAAEYDLRRPRIAGFNDVQAVRLNSDRSKRRALLGGVSEGTITRRIKERFVWHQPVLARRLARTIEQVAEATGSERVFLTARGLVHSSAYWEGVKTAGEDRESITRLVGSPVPALLFHATPFSLTTGEGDLHITSARLRKLLSHLDRMRYRTIQPNEYRLGPRMPHTVMLTFDDGYADLYDNAFPLLEQFGLKATVFIVTGAVGGMSHWTTDSAYVPRQLLSRAQISEMRRYGVQFGSHSVTHQKLTDLGNTRLRSEVVDSKAMLEDLLGEEVTSFAYPSGRVDERVRGVVAEAGYKIAFTTRPGLNHWGDPLLLNRAEISEVDTTADFLMKLRTGRGVGDELRHRIAPVVRGLAALAPGHVGARFVNALREMDSTRRRNDWEDRVRIRRGG